MALLKDVEAATHHDDQQAPDLCFDGSETARHAANAGLSDHEGLDMLERAVSLSMHMMS